MITQNEFNEQTSGNLGTFQIGTTAVTDKNFTLIKPHEAMVLSVLYVNGGSTDVRALYHGDGTAGIYQPQSFIIPRKDLDHKFFSHVDIDTGSAEGVLTDKN